MSTNLLVNNIIIIDSTGLLVNNHNKYQLWLLTKCLGSSIERESCLDEFHHVTC